MLTHGLYKQTSDSERTQPKYPDLEKRKLNLTALGKMNSFTTISGDEGGEYTRSMKDRIAFTSLDKTRVCDTKICKKSKKQK